MATSTERQIARDFRLEAMEAKVNAIYDIVVALAKKAKVEVEEEGKKK